ncbi:unnamed protein product [Auanema sp. JU1783]|nr:unnamed protein product [Auanema sp. JU1783]
MPPARKAIRGETRKRRGKDEPLSDLQGTIKIDLPLSNFLPGISEVHEQAISLYGGEVRALLKSVLSRKSLLKTLAAESDSVVPKTPKPRLGALANIARTIQLFDELSSGAENIEPCKLFSDEVDDNAEISTMEMGNAHTELDEQFKNISIRENNEPEAESQPESSAHFEPETADRAEHHGNSETNEQSEETEQRVVDYVPEDREYQRHSENVNDNQHPENVENEEYAGHSEDPDIDINAISLDNCEEVPEQAIVCKSEVIEKTPSVSVKQELETPERVTRSQSRKISKKPKPEPISPSPEYTRPSRTRLKAQEEADKAVAGKALAEKVLAERAAAGRCERIRNQECEKRVLTPHKHTVNTPTKPERREQVQKIISAQDRMRNAKAALPIPQPPSEYKATRSMHARMNDAKFQDIDQKLIEQQRRVEIAQQNRNIRVKEQSERLKRAHEEKQLRAQRNREEKEAKEKEKIEKKRLKDEEREKNFRNKLKSPARIGTNPSSRVASPSRAIFRPATYTPRAKVQHLFDEPGVERTPGRAAAKASKLMQTGGETAKGETFASPAREVKRKLVNKLVVPEEKQRLGFSDEDMKEQIEMVLKEQEMLLKQDVMRRRMMEEKEEEARQLALEQKRNAEELEEKRRREEKLKLEAAERKIKQDEEERARLEDLRKRQDQERVEQLRREAEAEKQRQLEKAREEMRKKEELRKEQEIEKENQIQSTPKPKNKLIEKNVEMYEMTPDKIFLPSSKDNYNIEDLSSGDETDCEDEPRKTVPEWASWSNLRKAGVEQFDPKMDTTVMFGFMPAPDLELIFGKTERKKSRRRASSGKWNSPASNPTKGMSRFLGF